MPNPALRSAARPATSPVAGHSANRRSVVCRRRFATRTPDDGRPETQALHRVVAQPCAQAFAHCSREGLLRTVVEQLLKLRTKLGRSSAAAGSRAPGPRPALVQSARPVRRASRIALGAEQADLISVSGNPACSRSDRNAARRCRAHTGTPIDRRSNVAKEIKAPDGIARRN